MSPLCESFVDASQLDHMEPFYPLHVHVCSNCYLVQLLEYVSPDEIFTEYAYFSSYSDTWLAHAREYVDMVVDRFGMGVESQVVEIASNDGYLLQYFVKNGIKAIGIEPAANVAAAAQQKGIETIIAFFGEETAKKLKGQNIRADLLLGNNVLAHVPDINDFIKGMQILLADDGIITMEFPHLFQLIEHNQFDTIYHEHFSYLSFYTVEQMFAFHGLKVFDVQRLDTHGGSLRVFACHQGNHNHAVTPAADQLKAEELVKGVSQISFYETFSEKVEATKRKLLSLLIEQKHQGKSIVGYGAPGKGNTLLNYCGIRTDFLEYTVDRNPYKHGKYTPGTHIPIFPPDKIVETRPDILMILPWNLKEEIMKQNAFIRNWGGKFLVPIPEPHLL